MSSRRHALEAVPLAPSSGVRPLEIPYTRAKTLGDNPLRLAARVRVLGWFREALREHPRGAAGVADELHISPTLLGYWTSGERDLAFADLVACPSAVVLRTLGSALDHLEASDPAPASDRLFSDAVEASRLAGTLVSQLERTRVPLEAMSPELKKQLLELVDEMIRRLQAIRRRLVPTKGEPR